jgi:TPR repeat protein
VYSSFRAFAIVVIATCSPLLVRAQDLPQTANGDQHHQDVEAIAKWWREFQNKPPEEQIARLAEWVKVHPEDGESWYWLYQVEEWRAKRDRSRAEPAVAALRKAADAGSAPARGILGWRMITGNKVPRDPDAGMRLLRAAVAAGDPEAHRLIAAAALAGAAPGGAQEAAKFAQRAIELGNRRALAVLAMAQEQLGRNPDALASFRRGAEAGDPQAQVLLSRWYADGIHVPRDPKEAERWGLAAAASGNPEYQRSLGEIYTKSATQEGWEKAIRWFMLGSAGGDAKAHYWLGMALVTGAGVQFDAERGVTTLRLAAQPGVPEAQQAIGQILVDGLLVKRDLAEAKSWFEKAAAKGDVKAQASLRWMKHAEAQAAK